MGEELSPHELTEKLPPRPLNEVDVSVLPIGRDGVMYGVRGEYDAWGEKTYTQFAVEYQDSTLVGFKYYKTKSEWQVLGTGTWPDDATEFDRAFNKSGSAVADWHRPLEKRVEAEA